MENNNKKKREVSVFKLIVPTAIILCVAALYTSASYSISSPGSNSGLPTHSSSILAPDAFEELRNPIFKCKNIPDKFLWGSSDIQAGNSSSGGGRGLSSYEWQPAPQNIKAKIDYQVPLDSTCDLDKSRMRIDVSLLPWYTNIRLVRVQSDERNPYSFSIYYLVDEHERFYWLNGTSPPIHDVNNNYPLTLTSKNVLEYTWFFCFFIRGEDGPFLLAESPEDAFIPKSVDATTNALLEKHLKPSTITSRNADESFRVNATIFYSNAIFNVDLLVRPSGHGGDERRCTAHV